MKRTILNNNIAIVALIWGFVTVPLLALAIHVAQDETLARFDGFSSDEQFTRALLHDGEQACKAHGLAYSLDVFKPLWQRAKATCWQRSEPHFVTFDIPGY